MLRRTTRSAVWLLAFSGLLVGVASATPVIPSQEFDLNLHRALRPNSGSVTVESPEVLANNKWYIAKVRGTGSFVKPSMWTNPRLHNGNPAVVCGTPAASPLLNSVGAATGQVGVDAEVMFAEVAKARLCRLDPTPRTTRLFEIQPKHIWRHPTPVDGRYSSPRPDHTYSYAVKGLGAKASSAWSTVRRTTTTAPFTSPCGARRSPTARRATGGTSTTRTGSAFGSGISCGDRLP